MKLLAPAIITIAVVLTLACAPATPSTRIPSATPIPLKTPSFATSSTTQVVARILGSNKLEITPSDLKERPNPQGEGSDTVGEPNEGNFRS